MSDTITISADQIELDDGDVMLQELSVGDPVEIAAFRALNAPPLDAP